MTMTRSNPLVAVTLTDRGGTFCAPAVLTRAEVASLVGRDVVRPGERPWLCLGEPTTCAPESCPHPATGRRHWTFRR